jgi:two-component system response regulator VicR
LILGSRLLALGSWLLILAFPVLLKANSPQLFQLINPTLLPLTLIFNSMAKTVLIIEDDRDTAEMLGYLAEMLNFDVAGSLVPLTVPDIHAIAPNLILMDHHLNGGLGSKLCLELKNTALTKHIPVILISAANNLAQIAKASCADHFIAKPFDIYELEKAILAYIK